MTCRLAVYLFWPPASKGGGPVYLAQQTILVASVSLLCLVLCKLLFHLVLSCKLPTGALSRCFTFWGKVNKNRAARIEKSLAGGSEVIENGRDLDPSICYCIETCAIYITRVAFESIVWWERRIGNWYDFRVIWASPFYLFM